MNQGKLPHSLPPALSATSHSIIFEFIGGKNGITEKQHT